MRQVLIYPGEDGFWVAECPSLPGCISQGENREEAVRNIREAIDLYIEALANDNLPIPQDRFEALLYHKQLDRGTLRSILRQADVSVEEFISVL
jgi:predicted RNase H-like HicB family nuclease